VGIDRARLDEVLLPIAAAHGAEVVDVEFKTEAGMGWVLRVMVEKAGSAEANATAEQAAVDLELCAGISRDLSPALDVADLIPHRYTLEVSSPGVERPLRTFAEFVRFRGKRGKLKLTEPAPDGQRVLVGEIGDVTHEPLGDQVTLHDGKKTHTVPFAQIASARLVFEFGPAPKPGKAKRRA
jgi:ribosome maturation factor RimP